MIHTAPHQVPSRALCRHFQAFLGSYCPASACSYICIDLICMPSIYMSVSTSRCRRMRLYLHPYLCVFFTVLSASIYISTSNIYMFIQSPFYIYIDNSIYLYPHLYLCLHLDLYLHPCLHPYLYLTTIDVYIDTYVYIYIYTYTHVFAL